MKFRFSEISDDPKLRRIQQEIEDNFVATDKNGNVVLKGNITAKDGKFDTNVTLTAGVAMAGGGTIAANLTFDVDVQDENLILATQVFG